jgi:plasmid maintenance system antidote protein VapI
LLIRNLGSKICLTQEELAVLLGITQTRVSELKSGKQAVSVSMAKRLADI